MAPATLQHTKENNFSQFARLIESMENRYMNSTPDEIVDINNLQIIRTRSGRLSKQRITNSTPNSSQNGAKTKKGRKPPSQTHLASKNHSPTGSPSSQDSSGFHDASDSQLTSPPLPAPAPASSAPLPVARSILFDRPAQLEATKNLLQIMKSGESIANKTAANLLERVIITLGRDELPNKANVRPFFTFHEDQDIGVTLLYDTPDLTPWTLICLKFFGHENLILYQQIYQFILAEAVTRANSNNMLAITMPNPSPPARRSAWLAVVSIHQSVNSKQMDMGSNQVETLTKTYNQQTHISSSNQSSSTKSSPSSLSSAYSTSLSTMPIYHPSIDSIVYENDKQLSSLKKLAEILRQNDGESKQVKRKLIARAFKALGHESMPQSPNIYPFFTFHEKGEIGVSFLFDIKKLSPWTTICKLYFGEEILMVCRDIYRMINQTGIASLERLEQLSNSYSPPNQHNIPSKKSLVKAISRGHEVGSENPQAMNTPIPRSIRRGSPIVINNTAPPLRRSPRSPGPGILDSPVSEPKRARMNSVSTVAGRAGRPRTRQSAILVELNHGNLQSDDIEMSITPPLSSNCRKGVRRTSSLLTKGQLLEPNLALTRRKSSLPKRGSPYLLF